MVSYFDYFQQILLGQELRDKLLDEEFDWNAFKSFDLPKNPGRSEKLNFSNTQLKFPKARSLHEIEKKALALHSFANHELLAIEMMATAILIYPHESEEQIRFKKGLYSALKDEQKHLSLYIKRINELGFEFGDFPLNDFFWRQMEKLEKPSQFVALMSLTLESANLDFAQYYFKIFKSLEDEKTASILSTVLSDELSHVSFGAYWMKKWRENKTLWNYYCESLPWPMTPARSKGIEFDLNLHGKAIGDEDFVLNLSSFQDDFLVTRRK